MTDPPDITVATRRHRTILVVECQTASDPSPSEAARLRNRLVTDYVDVPLDSYFMLVLPPSFYLWRPGVAPDALPSYSADALPILRLYLGELTEQGSWAFTEDLRLAVSLWLGDLTDSPRGPGTSEADRMVVDVGLYDLMRGGTVECGYYS